MSHSVLHPTLYTPATMPPGKLLALANGKVPGAWNVVFDTEDSVHPDELHIALDNLAMTFNGIKMNSRVAVYIRARNPEVMAQVLDLPFVERLRGFVIPKAEPESFARYANQIAGTDFRLMPILESPRMFDRYFREELRMMLKAGYSEVIDCVRIGANDMLGHLTLRRDDKSFTIYDTPLSNMIFEIINEFRGVAGFKVTAPVFECFDTQYDPLLLREVKQHIANGLFGQTVIHTRHLRLIRDAYKVPTSDRESAEKIISNLRAVEGVNGKMDEYATHINWAKLILERNALFGDTAKSQSLLAAISDEPVPVLT